MLTDALIRGWQTTHGVNVSGILTPYVSPFCKNKKKNLIAGYFFHDLTFRFGAVTLKQFQNYPCFRIFFFTFNNSTELWCPLKCVLFAQFNYISILHVHVQCKLSLLFHLQKLI